MPNPPQGVKGFGDDGFSKRDVFKIEDTNLNISGNLINEIYKLNWYSGI